MSSSDFEYLINMIGQIIESEKLALTLKFIARRDSFLSLIYLFRIVKQSISKIVAAINAPVWIYCVP